MTSDAAVLLSIVFTVLSLYVLFFVIRAAVEAGLRRALPDSLLRPLPGEAEPTEPQ